MNSLTESRDHQPLHHVIIALLLALTAPGCGSQGVNYVPQDIGVDDSVADVVSGDDTMSAVDTGPGWDWWAGDFLAWRAEDIPLNETFHAVSGVDDGDEYVVYVAGFRGAVLRFTSAVGVWVDVSPTTNRTIESVWAAGPKLAWICGEEGLLMRYEASAGATYPEWIDETDPLRTQTMNSIHGTGPDDVWVVGDDGLILHRTAAGWEQIPQTALGWSGGDDRDLNAVWAVAPDRVFVGGDGFFGSWDGTAWTELWSPSDSFVSISAHGDTIWVGTDGGYLWSWDGDNWVKQSAPIYYQYDAIWTAQDGRVFATGEDPSPQSIIWIGTKEPWEGLEVISPEGVGEQWAVIENSLITGLWGRDPEDLFACTQQQQILRYSKHD